ncbi:MAG: glucose-1-phosphate adenylyltransferase [Acetomicrobium sp.]|uniref:glucose-1-phosphate adenylyltransferase n=1 Tax=Acetomicrobium TaxID=49894 RepID=UPI0016B58B3C|nr:MULTISPECIES: glucose-1-phosphate adenylyltransferase [Acetomicrobium]MDI9377163.1 glucose-1-phosphate adenylyltransferase [Synergistota bacterium]NLI42715.1 glucose-1-phosphate adenylyltransferase [Synergistaceae bacterium]MDR9769604.1 glucose-1-phosphate adenylyltransferase [Acetomicrobium sp.]HOB10261.1 glucose-1-phosphate adenylyltransferase [Acetomicrobium sp.]HOM97146.1 glucose-1-phosphate adenylyltransferase [Acetomicrobium sp.]
MIYGKYGRVLGIVLAGGRGQRLSPLTRHRAKPAVHFAAKYRIIDFALSNLVNSGVFSIYVLVQFRSQSLNEHIERGWQFGGALRGRDFFITVVPAQMWTGEHWYKGTADAVFQNLHLITIYNADRICVFAADHVYKMDIEQMMEKHIEKKADCTVAAYEVPVTEAHAFGCLKTDERGFVAEFLEKPKCPPEIADKPGFSFISMGNYIFEREILEEVLVEDASNPDSSHDFGRDILPELCKKYKVLAYDFQSNVIPGNDKPYWRDVGTIRTYWQAHMDMLNENADLNLFNTQWPIRTVSYADPPGLTFSVNNYSSHIENTLRAEGSQILGATVKRSILSRNCIIKPGAVIEECIIERSVVIGERCKLRRVIVDAQNIIPPDTKIGFDESEDRARYHVDPSGIVVVPMPAIQLRAKVKFPYPDSGI